MDSALKLNELVAAETLERLRVLFKSTTGVPMAFTDADGTPVTNVEEPLRYCGALLCGHSDTLCLRRQKWDVPEPELEQALREGHGVGKPIRHRCRGGFRDAAVSIEVEGETVGYAVFARSLDAPPDLDKFRRLASEGGMDPQVGEQVARVALVMPGERIEAVAEFLQVIAGLVASAAYDSIQARRIIELEALRDSLIHMIVHDLRTPLTGIIGGLETVIHTQYERETAEEFVHLSLMSAETLLEMINTLLDINKMESGRMELALEPVDFAAVSEKAVAQVRGMTRKHEQQFTADIAPGCCQIVADGDKLRRVLINLLGNAVKFTPQGGHIRLTARPADDGMILSVSDDGPGIPEEDQARIFDKFGQVQTRNEGRMHSTGLGLTFCKMVAEAHGGRIWVESELGKGSTFSVFLPSHPPT